MGSTTMVGSIIVFASAGFLSPIGSTNQPFHRNDTSMPKILINTIATTMLFLVDTGPYLHKITYFFAHGRPEVLWERRLDNNSNAVIRTNIVLFRESTVLGE